MTAVRVTTSSVGPETFPGGTQVSPTSFRDGYLCNESFFGEPGSPSQVREDKIYFKMVTINNTKVLYCSR